MRQLGQIPCTDAAGQAAVDDRPDDPRREMCQRGSTIWTERSLHTHDGRKFRMLNVVDEFASRHLRCRARLAIRVARKLKAVDVIDVLSDLFILRGVLGHIRSDNGSEFIAKSVQGWIASVGSQTAHIAPGSPWENGDVENFNARPRDEVLDDEV